MTAGDSAQTALAALERLALSGPPQAEEPQTEPEDNPATKGGPPQKKQHRAGEPPPGEIGIAVHPPDNVLAESRSHNL